MNRELVFLRGVSQDFSEGFEYYESLSPGRGGARFEAAFSRALDQVTSGMVTHRQVFGFHRVFLPRFPYNLYYRIHGNCAVIVAVLYARFDPKRIEETLKQRTN